MKTELAILVTGIVIGFFARSFIAQNESTAPQSQAGSPQGSDVSSAPVVPAAANSTESAVREKEPPPQRITIKSSLVSIEPQRTQGPDGETAKDLSLTLDADAVEQMEHLGDRLKSFAYTVQTKKGWRIRILPEDRVFSKTGLKSGDFIPVESMQRQLQNPERAELAARMVAILNLIQR